MMATLPHRFVQDQDGNWYVTGIASCTACGVILPLDQIHCGIDWAACSDECLMMLNVDER